MKFIDDEHEKFYSNKLQEVKVSDVYYKSFIYTLGICEITRSHFNEIFNMKEKEIDLNSLQKAWQTTTSAKVTRMALNLWNSSIVYENEEDLESEKISTYYTPSEIFSCSYAPYLYEAIKIRYPEYAK